MPFLCATLPDREPLHEAAQRCPNGRHVRLGLQNPSRKEGSASIFLDAIPDVDRTQPPHPLIPFGEWEDQRTAPCRWPVP
jgi:hypothetical protein